MKSLVEEISTCTVCKDFLPFHPRPVIQVNPKAKIAIVGQAPGMKVQNTGIPWNDASGRELRRWMNVTDEQFYNSELFAIVPMGFCYPGKGKSGDLPPRPECAPLWHNRLWEKLPQIELTLLIGSYAQKYYLKKKAYKTLTETVQHYEEFLSEGYLPLVHPSPRNKLWQKKNPWFEEQIVPLIQSVIQKHLS